MPLELVFQDMETNPEKAIGRAEALNSRYNATVVVGTTLINATADILRKIGCLLSRCLLRNRFRI